MMLFPLISLFSLFCFVLERPRFVLMYHHYFHPQDTNGDDLEAQQEEYGVVPIRLLSNYLHVLKRKKEKKLLHVKSKIYLYILEHVVKCLPPAEQQSTVWWNVSNDNGKEYTMVQCGSVLFLIR